MGDWAPEPEPRGAWSSGLTDAIRSLGLPSRTPDDRDVPPPSTFPMTAAARAALGYKKDVERKLAAGKRRRTHG